MERSTIWSLSSPGGRLFDDRRITFNMRSPEGARATTSPAPVAAVPPSNAVEVVFPYTGLPCVDDPGSALYDHILDFPRIDQDRLHDAMGALYPFWTADDTSSCDDCPVRAYADPAWRDQGDEQEVL